MSHWSSHKAACLASAAQLRAGQGGQEDSLLASSDRAHDGEGDDDDGAVAFGEVIMRKKSREERKRDKLAKIAKRGAIVPALPQAALTQFREANGFDEMAKKFMDKNEFATAMAEFEKTAARFEEAKRCEEVGKTSMREREFDKAIHFFEQSLRLFPLPGVTGAMKRCQRCQKEMKGSVFKSLSVRIANRRYSDVSFAAESASSRFERLVAITSGSSVTASVEVLERLPKLDEAERCDYMGRLCMRRQEYERARGFFEKSRKIFPLPGVTDKILRCKSEIERAGDPLPSSSPSSSLFSPPIAGFQPAATYKRSTSVHTIWEYERRRKQLEASHPNSKSWRSEAEREAYLQLEQSRERLALALPEEERDAFLLEEQERQLRALGASPAEIRAQMKALGSGANTGQPAAADKPAKALTSRAGASSAETTSKKGKGGEKGKTVSYDIDDAEMEVRNDAPAKLDDELESAASPKKKGVVRAGFLNKGAGVAGERPAGTTKNAKNPFGYYKKWDGLDAPDSDDEGNDQNKKDVGSTKSPSSARTPSETTNPPSSSADMIVKREKPIVPPKGDSIAEQVGGFLVMATVLLVFFFGVRWLCRYIEKFGPDAEGEIFAPL